MRLPFLKLWQDAFVRARTVSRFLAIPEAHALGLEALLWAWGLEMSPEHEVTGIFDDPTGDPAGLIAAAIGWDGAKEKLLAAFIRVHIIELRPPTSFFIVGLPQYDEEIRARENDARRKRDERAKARQDRERLERNAASGDVNDKSSAVSRRSQDDHRTVADASEDVRRTSDGHPEDDPPSGGRPAPSGGRPADVQRTSDGRNGAKGGVQRTSDGRPADVLGRPPDGGRRPPESTPQTQTQTQSVVTGLHVVRGRSEEEEQEKVCPPPPPAPHPPTVDLEGNHPDREAPPPPCSKDAFLAAWFELRATIRGSRGRGPGKVELGLLEAVVAKYSEAQWRVAIRAYLTCTDPNARFTETYPLRTFLQPSVHLERIPEPIALRIMCAVRNCGRVADCRSPTNRGLCFACEQDWREALERDHPVPEWRRISDFARHEYSAEELEQNELERVAQEAAHHEQFSRRAEHFARWLTEQKPAKRRSAAP